MPKKHEFFQSCDFSVEALGEVIGTVSTKEEALKIIWEYINENELSFHYEIYNRKKSAENYSTFIYDSHSLENYCKKKFPNIEFLNQLSAYNKVHPQRINHGDCRIS